MILPIKVRYLDLLFFVKLVARTTEINYYCWNCSFPERHARKLSRLSSWYFCLNWQLEELGSICLFFFLYCYPLYLKWIIVVFVSLNPSKAIVASQLNDRIFNEFFFQDSSLRLGILSHSILLCIFRLLFSKSVLWEHLRQFKVCEQIWRQDLPKSVLHNCFCSRHPICPQKHSFHGTRTF